MDVTSVMSWRCNDGGGCSSVYRCMFLADVADLCWYGSMLSFLRRVLVILLIHMLMMETGWGSGMWQPQTMERWIARVVMCVLSLWQHDNISSFLLSVVGSRRHCQLSDRPGGGNHCVLLVRTYLYLYWYGSLCTWCISCKHVTEQGCPTQTDEGHKPAAQNPDGLGPSQEWGWT